MAAEVFPLRHRITPIESRPASPRHRVTLYSRHDWEQIEDHLWRASQELQRALALLYASRQDK